MSYKQAVEINEKNKKKTIFCGSGKKRKDNWFTATINMDKVKEHIQEYQGSKFIKINIRVKPEPDQFGKDVAISIDDWQPGEGMNDEMKKAYTNKETDLPF